MRSSGSELALSVDSGAQESQLASSPSRIWEDLFKASLSRTAGAVGSGKAWENRYVGLGSGAPHRPEPYKLPAGTVGKFFRRHLQIWGPRWAAKRRFREAAQRDDGPMSFETDSTNCGHLSVMVWNPGNLRRSGQSWDEEPRRQATMLNAYLLGSFHVVMVQEGAEMDSALVKQYDFRHLSSETCPDLVTLQGGSGQKLGRLVKAARVASPFKQKYKIGLDYHIAELTWSSNTQSQPILHSGLQSWLVLNFHIDHDEAKLRNVAGALLTGMFKDALDHKVSVIAGDANAAWSCGYLVHALEAAIDESLQKINFQIIPPTKDGDCLVSVILFYATSPKLNVKVSKAPGKLKVWELGLRPSDKDAHWPMILHITEAASKSRRRSKEAMLARAKKRKEKQRRKDKQKKNKKDKKKDKQKKNKKNKKKAAKTEC